MRYSIRYMQWLLGTVRLAVNVALKDDEIKSRISFYGYKEEGLNTALTLCQKAEGLLITRSALYGEQYTISSALRKKVDALYHYYIKYVKLVRKTLKRDSNALEILGLNSQRPRTMVGIIEKAKQFFQYLLSDPGINDRIKKFSITQQTMDDGLALIAAVEQDQEFQALKMSEAQDTTVQRNKTFQELFDWWAEFKQAAINSCEDRAQILERMGIVAHAEGYRKPKKEEPEPDGEPPAPTPAVQAVPAVPPVHDVLSAAVTGIPEGEKQEIAVKN